MRTTVEKERWKRVVVCTHVYAHARIILVTEQKVCYASIFEYFSAQAREDLVSRST